MEQQQLFVKMALLGWQSYIKRTNDLLDHLSEDRLLQEIAPGRNTGIYILGHLVAIHDHMLPILGLGEILYPGLDRPFVATPDKSGLPFPTVAELKEYWNVVNSKLTEGFQTFTTEDWFQRHSSVSAEDFEKEKHRNRLNILLGRTSHLAYHLGQLILLK